MKSGIKKGISTIIATVLVVLITVAAVSILWVGVNPLLDADVSTFETSLSVITSEGFTFYDPENKTAMIQIASVGDRAADYVQVIITLSDGRQLISTHDAPLKGGRKVLHLNLSDEFVAPSTPVSFSIAPIFIIDGEVVLGQKTNEVDFPIRKEDKTFYGDSVPDPSVGDNTEADLCELSGTCEDEEEAAPITLIEIDSCGELNASGITYLLTGSLLGQVGTCFTITNDSVTLDLGGFTVDGNNAGVGVSSDGNDDVTIMNGIIQEFSTGIDLRSSSDSTISNIVSTANSGSDGEAGEEDIVDEEGEGAEGEDGSIGIGIYLSAVSESVFTDITAYSNNGGTGGTGQQYDDTQEEVGAQGGTGGIGYGIYLYSVESSNFTDIAVSSNEGGTGGAGADMENDDGAGGAGGNGYGLFLTQSSSNNNLYSFL